MPLLDLKAVPVVESDGGEARVDLLISTVADGHGCPEISVGVPGHHGRNSLTLVTTPIVSTLASKKYEKKTENTITPTLSPCSPRRTAGQNYRCHCPSRPDKAGT